MKLLKSQCFCNYQLLQLPTFAITNSAITNFCYYQPCNYQLLQLPTSAITNSAITNSAITNFYYYQLCNYQLLQLLTSAIANLWNYQLKMHLPMNIVWCWMRNSQAQPFFHPTFPRPLTPPAKHYRGHIVLIELKIRHRYVAVSSAQIKLNTEIYSL